MTAGEDFRAALEQESPLRIVGTINAYTAMLAERSGFRAIYLSGAGVANASYGRPDLGFTTLAEVLEDTRRIVAATKLPLLVDVDTGWDDVADTTRQLISAGAGAIQMEDQVEAKRCGHRPGKQLVTKEEMCDRVRAAVSGRAESSLVIMARTDAVASEGLAAAIERSNAYVECGADVIFAEAIRTLDDFTEFAKQVNAPVLANMTEFGLTPAFTTQQLHDVGVGLALFPLSAFRAMNLAAQQVYQSIAATGTSAEMLDQMQTREELYDVLGYHKQEQAVDAQRAVDNGETK